MAEKTLERQRYELVQRNQASMAQVETLLEREAGSVLTRAESFGQQELGGYLRTVVPGLVDKYGNVNAALALKYYDEQRLLAKEAMAFVDRKTRQNQNRRAERIAGAKLQSEIYVASLPKFDAIKTSEPIIGYGMARFMQDGHPAMRDAVTNAMTRAVASYNRDTILYNAGLDSAVVTVQRVAEPTACAFCALMAFSSTRSASGQSLDVRVTQYAVDFHDKCRCSIETLYEGDQPFRPDYYDQFEQEYLDSYSGGSAKSKLQDWRANTGRR